MSPLYRLQKKVYIHDLELSRRTRTLLKYKLHHTLKSCLPPYFVFKWLNGPNHNARIRNFINYIKNAHLVPILCTLKFIRSSTKNKTLYTPFVFYSNTFFHNLLIKPITVSSKISVIFLQSFFVTSHSEGFFPQHQMKSCVLQPVNTVNAEDL